MAQSNGSFWRLREAAGLYAIAFSERQCRDQLTAALALIELDGVASRLVRAFGSSTAGLLCALGGRQVAQILG